MATGNPHDGHKFDELRLPARWTSVDVAKDHVEQTLRNRGFDDVAPRAALLVAELVGESVWITGGAGRPPELAVRLRFEGGAVVLEVRDSGSEFPRLLVDDNGVIIDSRVAQSDESGQYRPHSGGTVMWCRLLAA